MSSWGQTPQRGNRYPPCNAVPEGYLQPHPVGSRERGRFELRSVLAGRSPGARSPTTQPRPAQLARPRTSCRGPCAGSTRSTRQTSTCGKRHRARRRRGPSAASTRRAGGSLQTCACRAPAGRGPGCTSTRGRTRWPASAGRGSAAPRPAPRPAAAAALAAATGPAAAGGRSGTRRAMPCGWRWGGWPAKARPLPQHANPRAAAPTAHGRHTRRPPCRPRQLCCASRAGRRSDRTTRVRRRRPSAGRGCRWGCNACSRKRVVIHPGWVFFIDFARLTTRPPHGAYVRGAEQTRVDPHWGSN